jgi:hypothetical protein
VVATLRIAMRGPGVQSHLQIQEPRGWWQT